MRLIKEGVGAVQAKSKLFALSLSQFFINVFPIVLTKRDFYKIHESKG